MLEEYAERYREELLSSVMPFWLKNSLDTEHGGYFSCLDREGRVYDTKKYMWVQGREVWMFSRLYNTLERKDEHLEAAKFGVDFIRKYGRDSQGRYYFSLNREGKPFFYQRKPYAAVFCMLGLLEYHRTTGDAECLQESVDLFWRILEWIDDPGLIGRPVLPGQVRASSLANVMVAAAMAIELAAVDDDPRYLDVMRTALADVERHYDPQRRILIENAPLDGTEMPAWPEARFFIPGHSIEVAWFILHLLEFVPSEKHKKLALDVLEGSMEFGWDKEFGGLYYFMDIEGKPVLQMEASMKLWWPHTEALYAFILAYKVTGDERWLEHLRVVDAYTWDHYPDRDYGEWFGYCDRRGNVTNTCKGGSYKGCFHVPRALLMSVQAIEQT